MRAHQRTTFDFEPVPGDRFSQNETVASLGMSRTPVREALARLQRDGSIETCSFAAEGSSSRSTAKAYHRDDLRVALETTAVRRVVDLLEAGGTLPRSEANIDAVDGPKRLWLVASDERRSDGRQVAAMDEAFDITLVEAAGHPELAKVHREVTERIASCGASTSRSSGASMRPMKNMPRSCERTWRVASSRRCCC